ncbi:rolling circle replication-associated protein [Proteocatella sphenisci]|uniref:rolling circle replication-associated protein n=1 Tax=Proteocatella sphenisci TaxID=181070 RepID=UPI00048AEDD4|nr:hypothetical protein [Proteocatella sphenisci]
MLKQRAYDYNICVLKKYNDNTYKLTRHNVLRVKGVEIDDKISDFVRGSNDKKMLESISRTKSTIFEYGMCNDWDFFVTFTIDKNKHDRYDLKAYYAKFSQFLRNYNKRHNLKVKYLFIPEKHKDGAWHMHGFMSGLPESHLTLLTEDMVLPYRIIEKIRKGEIVYSWASYSERFGFLTMEKIRDKDKASSYITKYISKDLADCISDTNSKMYYCSKGLKKAEIVKKGRISANIHPSFSNDYVEIKYFDNADLALSYFDE